MLLVSAAKLLRTTLLIFLLLQLRIETSTFVLSHVCELPGSHDLVVTFLLQHWHVLQRVLP